MSLRVLLLINNYRKSNQYINIFNYSNVNNKLTITNMQLATYKLMFISVKRKLPIDFNASLYFKHFPVLATNQGSARR